MISIFLDDERNPEDVKERDCYWFGEAMVDVGRLGAYARFSNVIEITNQDVKVD